MNTDIIAALFAIHCGVTAYAVVRLSDRRRQRT
jgi:hypothetical protein